MKFNDIELSLLSAALVSHSAWCAQQPHHLMDKEQEETMALYERLVNEIRKRAYGPD